MARVAQSLGVPRSDIITLDKPKDAASQPPSLSRPSATPLSVGNLRLAFAAACDDFFQHAGLNRFRAGESVGDRFGCRSIPRAAIPSDAQRSRWVW